jgi:hypothetical protein
MEPLTIEKTDKTPHISLKDGVVQIFGRSITEDPNKFYKPVFEWLKEYENTAADNTQINIRIEYSDTGSSKCILDILKQLDDIFNNDNDMIVNWYYEEGDDDMYDQGVYFKTFVNIPFNFIEFDE